MIVKPAIGPRNLFQLSVSCLALASTTAQAQTQAAESGVADDDTGVQEIVVTAQKRAENLQDVPIAISALTAEALETRGINGLQEMQTVGLPGVQIQAFGGQQSVIEVQIRGATVSSSNDAGREASTAIYLDDVYQPRAQSGALTLADPQRIEVLRGPQGQLFGRGAVGGALRIVSTEPTGKAGGRASVTYGNYDTQKYEAHLNLPEFGGFAIKLDGVIDKHDGYTHNIRAANIARGNDFSVRDDKGFRISLKWTPSTDFRAVYAFNYIDSFTTPEYETAVPRPSFIPSVPLPTPAAMAFYGMTSAPIFRGPVPIRSTRPDRSWAPFYVYGFDTQSEQQSLKLEYNASDRLTIRSITGRGIVKLDSLTQNAGTILAPILFGAPLDAANLVPFREPLAGAPAGQRVYGIGGGGMSFSKLRSEFFSEELQFVGDFDQHQMVAGIYYSNEKIRQQSSSAFDTLYFDPNNTGAAVVRNLSTYVTVNPFYTSAASKAGVDTRVDSRSFAIFAQDTFTPSGFDDKLHLTAGIRYTDDQKSGVRKTDGLAQAGTILRNIPLPVLTTKRFDPAATIAYDITAHNNVYLRYSRAYKAGGYNLTSASLIIGGVPTVINFGPEQNNAFELGLKNEFFDRRLRLNVAAFYSKIDNQQLNVFAIPAGQIAPVAQTINAPGTTKTKGVEVESSLTVAEGLTVNLNYAYLDQDLPTITAALDPAVGLPRSPTSSPAMYFPSNSPKHTVSGAIDYEAPIAEFGTFFVHLDGSYSSLFRTTNRQSQFNYLVPRRLESVNGRIGVREIEIGGARLAISAFMNNITDNNARQGTAGFGDVFFMPPRTYGLQMTAAF